MNRFARIMQLLGWAGAALLTVVWTQGYFVRGETPELGRHTMIALAAACLCVLPRFWTAAYLLLAARGRATRQCAQRPPGEGAPSSERAARLRRDALASALFALIALSASFSLGGAILLRRVDPVTHAVAGVVVILSQIVALFLERRALLADGVEMRKMGETEPVRAPV